MFCPFLSNYLKIPKRSLWPSKRLFQKFLKKPTNLKAVLVFGKSLVTIINNYRLEYYIVQVILNIYLQIAQRHVSYLHNCIDCSFKSGFRSQYKLEDYHGTYILCEQEIGNVLT